MTRPVAGALLSAAAIAVAGAALAACTFVRNTADSMARGARAVGAPAPAADFLEGTARAAESMQDYEPSHEYYIGRAVAAEILSKKTLHADEDLQRYVNLVGLAVALGAPEVRGTYMGYRFAVLDGDEVQAVSAPGGFVFVTIGALRRAEDEDELAALLAHEIAHVSLEHGLKAIKAATRNTSFQLLAKAGGEGALQATGSGGSRGTAAIAGLATNLGDVVSDITGDLLVKGYSRELELEADAAAAKYLESSGYARAALAAYLERLQSGGGAGGWFDTHPAPAERIAALGAAPAAAPEPRAARRERFLASLKR